jgi:hypothetical protein
MAEAVEKDREMLFLPEKMINIGSHTGRPVVTKYAHRDESYATPSSVQSAVKRHLSALLLLHFSPRHQ